MMESFHCEFCLKIAQSPCISIIMLELLLNIYILSDSCWLSTERGTIFAFVVPMLIIIIVSENE